MKILEFFDNKDNIQNQILAPLDFNVGEDLLVFMRNDPVFYRKTFFPAIEDFKISKGKNKTVLNNAVKAGLDKYCSKYKIEHPKDELLTDGDVLEIVNQIIEKDIYER